MIFSSLFFHDIFLKLLQIGLNFEFAIYRQRQNMYSKKMSYF